MGKQPVGYNFNPFADTITLPLSGKTPQSANRAINYGTIPDICHSCELHELCNPQIGGYGDGSRFEPIIVRGKKSLPNGFAYKLNHRNELKTFEIKYK